MSTVVALGLAGTLCAQPGQRPDSQAAKTNDLPADIQSLESETQQATGSDESAMAVLVAIETTLVSVIERCERSVVAIARVPKDRAARSPLDVLHPVPSLRLTNDPANPDFVPQFFGSGVIVGSDGHIVTCAHVLDDPRHNSYYVWMDRRCYPAEVVGKLAQPLAADPFSDLAMLKIEAHDLPLIPVSDQPARKGQFVVALGNPYSIARDGQASAAWAMIANVNRYAPRDGDSSPSESIHYLGTLLQTDSRQPIGSSGGALINLRGQLVGISTSLLAQRGNEQSAGLAVATDDFFKRVVESLKQGRLPEYGFLGIQPEDLQQSELDRGLRGARISMVLPGLPGSLAGLREGDLVVQVDDNPIHSRNDLFRELSKVPTGRKVSLVVQRIRPGASEQTLSLEAELSKKFLATSRPSFSLHGPPIWRGAQIEFLTAIDGQVEQIAVARGSPRVALLSVAPDSPAWKAGLRAGYGVASVNGQAVQTPDQFHQLVQNLSGQVTVVAITSDGQPTKAVVQP
ncbi:MAG: trypsin-like peptidase domain-containing protein [Pirellulaceae bacterium]|nr:trypsin-like peptidase domain-containing protein [Pirellulaceae bacterium]